MREIELWSADGLTIRAGVDDHGSLVISGHDLRADRVFGPEAHEYEYELRVQPADLPRVIAGLGGQVDDDVLDLLGQHGAAVVQAGEQTWLRGIGIEPLFWSRIGD